MKYLSTRELRLQLGMTQMEFWDKVGVTQSGGSRYENGSPMPWPVRELVRIVHVENIHIELANRDDMEIINLLKGQHTDLYAALKKRFASKPTSIYIERRGIARRSQQPLPSTRYGNRRVNFDRRRGEQQLHHNNVR